MSQTIRNLVGQSLMLRFTGRSVTPELVAALASTRANGVILFADNVGTPAELHALTSGLQAQAAALGLPPLLIGIDQEGGIVGRLPLPFTTVPSQMAQAATGDPASAYACAQLTGQQLRAFGINLNFAPVLDVNCNPANPVIGTRAFGQDAATVTSFGLEALRGYRDAAVIATAKHFPGHGDTDVDSHLGLPLVRHARSRLDEVELAPFVAAFRAGLPALMTAHIIFEAIDPLPATLSRAILTGLLRHELGYQGVVFTDALEMRAIAATYGPIEAALRSKAAGADVLLPLGRLSEQVAIAEALCRAVEDSSLPRTAFEATAQRLDALRAAYQITGELPPFNEPDAASGSSAREIARCSITVMRSAGLLPLPRTTRLVLIDCMLPRFSLVEEAVERAELLRELVEEAFPHTTSVQLGPEPTDDEIARAQLVARTHEAVLLVTRQAFLIRRQAQLAHALVNSRTPVLHAVVRNPYDAAVVTGTAASLLTYGDPPVSLHALVDVLAGRAAAGGKLPVDMPTNLPAEEP